MKITICVVSYKRPKGLMALLESLGALAFRPPCPDVEVVVVDNDTRGAVAGVCAELQGRFRWRLQCLEEARRGIPFARNRALSAVAAETDFVAFVDDDETVEPDWLDELLRVQAAYQADVVAGAVVPRFQAEPPAWMRRGRFFELPRYETGTRIDFAYTNNALFRARLFREEALRFDQRMALVGGSDSHLARRIHQQGYRLVFANEAVVYDWLPRSRISARWLLQRAYRYGCAQVFVNTDLCPAVRTRINLAVSAARRLLRGAWFTLSGVLVGRARFMSGLVEICRAAGMVMGLLGARYREYRTTHGD